MGFFISTISKNEKLVEGFNFIVSGLPVGIWHTISLDGSTANKKVEIHIRNNASWRTSRAGYIRQIDDTGAPIGVGIQIFIGGRSTTSTWVTTNKNAQIQIRVGGNGLAFFHRNTLK